MTLRAGETEVQWAPESKAPFKGEIERGPNREEGVKRGHDQSLPPLCALHFQPHSTCASHSLASSPSLPLLPFRV